MNLWSHQQRALEELRRAISQGYRRICVTSPTGGGKSRIMFEHIAHSRTKTALYTYRRMLCRQISDGLTWNGINHGVRAAGYEPRLLDDIQLCLQQTQVSRLERWGVHPAEHVIVDEAHQAGAGTWLSLFDEHKRVNDDVVIIGFSATPLGIGHVYDKLIVAGTNTELRACGALVPAYTFGPDEPDTKWIGKIAVGEGECGLPTAKRMEYAHRVFGRVVENWRELNPEQLPTLLFAPGVKESRWFCQKLNDEGIDAAHIDGEGVLIDGEELPNNEETRAELAARNRVGDIKIVCNRFVLREGIDWPWTAHGIFATVFGSLTSYIQAGGRLLRAYPGKDKATVQDHGGNWWRHGSLNSDREWDLSHDDRIAAGIREQKIREKQEPQPIVCPKCHAARMSGPKCWKCGHQHEKGSRVVLQADGSLREMRGDIFKARRVLTHDQQIEEEWVHRVRAIRKSQKPTVQSMTFAQLEATFARDHEWRYAPRTLPSMPVNDADWFRPIKDVPEERLSKRAKERV